ncbi:MAG: CPBP family intramembrane glutamic endopeptidase [Candidatus Thorarchaeota archaeon]
MEDTNDSHRRNILIVAWTAVLLTSNLAIIFWRELGPGEPIWWPWIHVVGLLVILVSTQIVKYLKPLREFVGILLTIFLLGYGAGWNFGLIPFIRDSAVWTTWMGTLPSMVSAVMVHVLRLVPAVAVLLFLLVIGLRRVDFFLIKGDIRAPVEPSRIIGMKESDPWTKTGSIFAVIITVVTVVLFLGSWETPVVPLQTLLLAIPVAMVIATINAFNEEFTLRAAPLSVLWERIGKEQALLLTTVYFALGHFYGYPSGVIGILLAGFLGYFLGKSLLETKGFFWAWLIHFLPDVVIFTFILMAA